MAARPPRAPAGCRAVVDGVEVWVDAAELDRERLAALHARRTDQGATAPAAAKWLSSWFPGAVAGTVGWALATASVALVVEPARVRWRLHPEGWPDALDVGSPALVVAADHPWAGLPGAVVVPAQEQVREAAVAGLVAVAQPVVEVLRTVAKVGRPSLWAEVGDRLGMAVLHDVALDVHPRAVEELQAVVRVPGAPWRVVPRLLVESTSEGPAYLGQKGGCCLAYQCADAEEPDPVAEDPDPVAGEHAAWAQVYRRHFPPRPGQPDYCSTCSLLEADECSARQRLWIEHHRAAGGLSPNATAGS